MTEVKTNQPNVLKVRPGLYYLRAVHVLGGYYKL